MACRPSPRCPSRGVSTVEYALLLALVSVVCIVAVQTLGNASNESVETTASALDGAEAADTESGDGGDGGDDGGSGGGPSTPSGSGDGTPTPPSTTSTTAAAAPTTTSTTAAPTTTTSTTAAPTTTTTAPPLTGGGGFTDPEVYSFGSSLWTVQTVLTVQDSGGAPVAGADVTVTVRSYTRVGTYSWDWLEDDVEASTGANGTVTIADWFKRSSGTWQVAEVEIVLTDLELPGGMEWDGEHASVSADKP